jgi:sphingomyelin phosphodiesterase 2
MNPNHHGHKPSTLLRRKDNLKVEFKDPPATTAPPTRATSTMEHLPPELHVLTLNCWGLKHISTLRNERLLEIGRRIAKTEPTPNIVALQECWCQDDYRAVRRETRVALPYGKFYHSGAFGGGLVILSKWPIEESSMFRYPLNGRPTAFWRGDWYVGKGVACAKIRFGPGQKDVVEVFNTHVSGAAPGLSYEMTCTDTPQLHAPYEQEPNDTYTCHRTAQAWEIAKLLRGAAERGHLALAVGDFNMLPLSLAHRIVTSHAPVRDAWRVLHPESSLGPANHPHERARRRPIPTADYNVKENGVTSDSVFNTWRWTKAQRKLLGEGKEPCIVPGDAIDKPGKRLDYIFVGAGVVADAGGAGWVVKNIRVGMVERHPRLGCSLSDHFSVEATLMFYRPLPVRKANPDSDDDDAFHKGTYLQTQHSPSNSISGAAPNSEEDLYGHQLRAATPSLPTSSANYEAASGAIALPAQTYDDILALIHKYMRRERTQRRYRSVHFLAALLVWIGCLAGVWFVPYNFVAFVLLLAGSLVLLAGTVDGLMALLFFGSEIRALKEFEWEVMNAKSGGDLAEVGGDKVLDMSR